MNTYENVLCGNWSHSHRFWREDRLTLCHRHAVCPEQHSYRMIIVKYWSKSATKYDKRSTFSRAKKSFQLNTSEWIDALLFTSIPARCTHAILQLKTKPRMKSTADKFWNSVHFDISYLFGLFVCSEMFTRLLYQFPGEKDLYDKLHTQLHIQTKKYVLNQQK